MRSTSVTVRLLAGALALAAAGAAGAQTTRVSVTHSGAQVADREAQSGGMSWDGRHVVFVSTSAQLVTGDTNAASDVFVRDRQDGRTTRVSVATGGRQAGGESVLPAISGDGRFVAFVSIAGDLVAGDANQLNDVFVHDRATGITTRVSVGIGGADTNGSSSEPSISVDGRFVAFSSRASNIVSGDTNGGLDVFLHDRATGATSRVSLGSAGAQAGAGSWGPVVSADGRHVAFVSRATNLVDGDTNNFVDVFVRDRAAGTTTRVSVSSGGGQANSASVHPSMSADGRYVAFASDASNLVAGDLNGVYDAFVHDRQSGTTRRASVSTTGAEANGPVEADISLSADGQRLAFSAGATNLVPGDTNGEYDVFVRDLVASTTTRASLSEHDAQATGGLTLWPVLSGDGRYVTCTSYATNMVEGDTNSLGDVFVRDLRMHARSEVSRHSGVGVGESTAPRASGDGRYIVFESMDPTLVAGDTNGTSDIFLFDRVTLTTTRMSVASGGLQANGNSYAPDISGDGRYIVFDSDATTLVSGDTNGAADVFVHDRLLATTTRVSVSDSGAQARDAASWGARISADGRFIAFVSDAANLVSNDVNATSDVFVHDMVLRTTTRMSVASTGAGGNGESRAPSISGDGRYVVFHSRATNLVAGDSNGTTDVFVHDRVQHTTARVSLASDGHQADGPSEFPSISADGRWVVFSSLATNLVSGDTNAAYDVFLHDRATAGTTRVSVASGGRQLAGASAEGVVSGDGRVVVFTSLAADVVPGDANGLSDVFTYDRTTGQTRRVSLDQGNGDVVAGGGAPALSADARTIAYEAGKRSSVYVRATTPVIAAISPRSGTTAGSTSLRIGGEGFVPGTTVSIGGMSAVHVDGSETSRVVATTLARPAGRADVVVTVPGFGPERLVSAFAYVTPGATTDADGDGMSDVFETRYSLDLLDPRDASHDDDRDGVANAQEQRDGTHPRGTVTRYLAEGATSPFFTTRLALTNPGDADATVLLRFLPVSADAVPHVVTVPAHSRQTVDVGSVAGLAQAEFATVLESDRLVVLDRLMTWDANGYGSTIETAMTSLSREWFLAEGATHSGFDLFHLLQNPAATATTVQVTFLRPAPQEPIVKHFTLAPQSRFNVWVDTLDPGLADTDVSAAIVASQPIAVERALYLSRPGQLFTAGHESAGVTAPALTWFLAEGATGPYFDEFILLANPNTTPSTATVTFLTPDGRTVVQTHTVAPQSRFSIWVDYADPALADTAVSTTVEVTNDVPIVVERAMWWPSDASRWHEAHNSPGATSAGLAWVVSGGEDGGPTDTETYVLIANTAEIGATVRVSVLLEDGHTHARLFSVPARSRFNVQLRAEFAAIAGQRFGVLVESIGLGTAPIVVESAIYGDANGVPWQAGANALATRLR